MRQAPGAVQSLENGQVDVDNNVLKPRGSELLTIAAADALARAASSKRPSAWVKSCEVVYDG